MRRLTEGVEQQTKSLTKERENQVQLKMILLNLIFVPLFASVNSLAATAKKAEPCTPEAELKFLCGMQSPEDLIALPGNRWIVASGMAKKSGLHLINAETKAWERLLAPPGAKMKQPFQACPSQLASDDLEIHGISFRVNGKQGGTLYAVNHGTRESIEVFEVNMGSSKPTITWAGCVPMPKKLAGNSVVATKNGTLYTTVMIEPGFTLQDSFDNRATGAIYKWMPGDSGFKRLPDTEMIGNNAVEISKDEKVLYAGDLRGITTFEISTSLKRLARLDLKDAVADNLHWVNGRLILGGQRTDAGCTPGIPICVSGYVAIELDPISLSPKMLAKGSINKSFAGTSAATIVGDTLWLGSFLENKVAYRTLP